MDNKVIERQVDMIRQDVVRDLSILTRSGFSITDAISRMDQLIYKKDLLEA
jgi:hypothetical protein